MKKLLCIVVMFLSFSINAQTTNPTPTNFTNGLLPPVKGTAPFLGKGSIWYDTVADALKYYNGTSWITLSAALVSPVNSVFGRTGAVVAQTGDYTASQVGAYPATGNPSNFLTSYTETDPLSLHLTGTETFAGYKKGTNMLALGTGAGAGYTGVNTANPVLDIANGTNSLIVVGAESSAQTRTDATTKVARISGAPYNVASLPTAIVYVSNNSTDNTLSIGGGTSSQNASTRLNFYAGGTNTTATGTEMLRISTSGIDFRSGKLGIAGTFGTAGQSIRNNAGNTGLEFYTPSAGGSGTVTSFGKVDGYGITSSVANSTTTPVLTIAVDSTSATGLVSKSRLTAYAYSKAQTDALIPATVTASNGITRTGNNLALGGLLTSGTQVTTNGQNLLFAPAGGVAGHALVLATNGTSLGYLNTSGSLTRGINIPNTGVNLFYDSDNVGLQYSADYSANYTNRTLVDKGYVTSVATTTASNGLTKTGNDIALGGAITGTGANIVLSDVATQNVTIGAAANTNYSGYINVRSGVSGTLGRLTLGLLSTSSLVDQINFTSTGMSVVSNVTAKGLEYASDYSSTFTSRSLVDKGYVDSRLPSVVEVAGTTQALAGGNTYIFHNTSTGITASLPSTNPPIGSLITIIVDGVGRVKITQGASQYIVSGSTSSTVGATGYVITNTDNSTISLRYVATNKYLVSASNSTPTIF